MDKVSEIAGRITDTELELMEIVWDISETEPPVTVKKLRLAAEARLKWKDGITKTLLSRLTTKEAVTAEKHEVFYYTPNISREQYRRYFANRVIDRLFGGSAKRLAASLVESDRLTAEDIAELQAMFDDDVD